MDLLSFIEPLLAEKFAHQPANYSRHFAKFLQKMWESRLLPKPDFGKLSERSDEIDQGCSVPAPWREPLDRLVGSLSREAQLNEIGVTFAYVQLQSLLEQRARAQRLWADNPQIAQINITKPIIILGHMRSGTTRIHRLLGCDPQFHHTRFYEVMSPISGWPDWRVPKSWLQLQMMGWLNPEAQFVHPTAARSVEEVFGLLSFSFYGAQIEAQWQVPAFARYWEMQDKHWVYEEFQHLLKTLAWQRGEPSKPWVLKAPQFMEDLDVLLDIFPDARLVCLQRDLDEVVASSASLVWNQMKLQSDEVDRHWIGREWTRKTRRREEISRSVRRARPNVPQIDLTFNAVNCDWRSEMRRLYAFLDIELPPEVEKGMQRYLDAAEKSGFRQHRYHASDFGLPAADAEAGS